MAVRTVRTTEDRANRLRALPRPARLALGIALSCAACLVLVGVTGCWGGTSANSGQGSDTTKVAGAHMAGAQMDVHINPETLANRPAPWVLTSPQSAVKSYLDWTAYAYRIGQSDVASLTMGSGEFNRVDAYTQLNLEKAQLLDENLKSVKYGTPSVDGTQTKIPTRENWSYRYVSIKNPGQTVGGPYTASYDATYTVVKSYQGQWLVTAVDAKALGPVK